MPGGPHVVDPRSPHPHTPTARVAGALYAVIIAAGIWSEVAVRSSVFVAGDASLTAANLLSSTDAWRHAFAADAVMVVCDVVIAALLFMLLRPVGATGSLVAMVSRLTQAAILGVNLLAHHAALLVLERGRGLSALAPEVESAFSYLLLDLQRDGYDLGLVFFGINCLVTGGLLIKARVAPTVLGVLVMGAGGVYLVGSALVFLWPAHAGAFEAAYLLPLVAESAFCVWLLSRGLGRRAAAPTLSSVSV